MALRVVQGGLQATVQDLGRRGLMAQGLSRGGAMDQFSLRWANRLVGNPDPCAALEITFGQTELECQMPVSVAIAGGDLGAEINGIRCPMWRALQLNRGDRLRFLQPRSGLRAYLAVAGGFDVPAFGDSASTVPREQLGGYRGRAVGTGDVLDVGRASKADRRTMPSELVPDYTAPLLLNVIPGYQFEQFPEASLRALFNTPYQVSPQIDRMGYRIDGQPVQTPGSALLSEGNATGAVQIPADGKPIVLMRDGQTIGGYPKVGVVCAADLDQLAQRGPGAEVRFQPIDWRSAAVKRHLSAV